MMGLIQMPHIRTKCDVVMKDGGVCNRKGTHYTFTHDIDKPFSLQMMYICPSHRHLYEHCKLQVIKRDTVYAKR